MPDLQAKEADAAAVATAPRVTLDDVNAAILCEQYITSADIDDATHIDSPSPSVLTIAVLTLSNGFQVTGESACASAANFNAELGRKIARDKAVEKVWMLLGFELRSKIVADAQTAG